MNFKLLLIMHTELEYLKFSQVTNLCYYVALLISVSDLYDFVKIRLDIPFRFKLVVVETYVTAVLKLYNVL